MKIIIMVILVALATLTIYLLIGVLIHCIFNWGCDAPSFEASTVNLLAVPLVYPAYFIYILPQMVFGEPSWPTNIMLAIMGAIEIIYLYLLSCIIASFATKLKKKVRLLKKNEVKIMSE